MNMDEPCFSVAEAVDIVGVPEPRFRDWLRQATLVPIGTKKTRWTFSARDIYIISIARDLISGGYAPHRALMAAFRIGGSVGGDMRRGGKPFRDEFALVPLADDFDAEPVRGTWSGLKGARRSGVFVPLWALYKDTQDACAAIYSEPAE